MVYHAINVMLISRLYLKIGYVQAGESIVVQHAENLVLLNLKYYLWNLGSGQMYTKPMVAGYGRLAPAMGTAQFVLIVSKKMHTVCLGKCTKVQYHQVCLCAISATNPDV